MTRVCLCVLGALACMLFVGAPLLAQADSAKAGICALVPPPEGEREEKTGAVEIPLTVDLAERLGRSPPPGVDMEAALGLLRIYPDGRAVWTDPQGRERDLSAETFSYCYPDAPARRRSDAAAPTGRHPPYRGNRAIYDTNPVRNRDPLGSAKPIPDTDPLRREPAELAEPEEMGEPEELPAEE